MLPSEVSHSCKLPEINLFGHFTVHAMVQWYSYTTGAPLVVPKPNPFCTVGFTSCGAFGPTTLLLPTSIHTVLFSHVDI